MTPDRYSLTMYSDPYGPKFATLAALLVWWDAAGTLTHGGVQVWNDNACDGDSNGLTEDEQEIVDIAREVGAINCALVDREHCMIYEGPGEHGGSDYRCAICGTWEEA